MVSLFYSTLLLLFVAELVKGLSANGTPPVLQKFSWQLDLAHIMWTNILVIRIVLTLGVVAILWSMTGEERSSVIIGGVLLVAAWGFVYWLFNFFWVGKYKFLPLENPVFATRSENQIDLIDQVMGVDLGGIQKAYPVNMIFYHHQLADKMGNQAIWVTYCGMCRSGRVYDRVVNGQALNFALVGAITYNAILRDLETGTWWRQETGEAAKGKLQGTILEDIPMEQMSLENWLAKYPESEVLQYEPQFQKKYDFFRSLLRYEASLPGWHRQETPPLVIGVELENHARAYDWEQLKKKRLVLDQLGDNPLVLFSSEDGTSPFVYIRKIDDQVLDFEIEGDELTDAGTGSKWNIFGQCIDGKLQGKQLQTVQIYSQFQRAWAEFHPNTTYYNYQL